MDLELDTRIRAYCDDYTSSLEIRANELPSLVLHLNELLPGLLGLIIQETIAELSLSTGVSFVSEDDCHFVYDSRTILVEIITDTRTEKTLLITLRPLTAERSKMAKFNFFPTKSHEPYSRFGLRLDRSLAVHTDPVIATVTSTIESYGLWLDGFVRRSILAGRNAVVDQLYSHLRSLFSTDVSSRIFLYALARREGIYVFDSLSLDKAISSVTRGAEGLGQSALALINQLAFTKLPMESMAAQVAIPENMTIQLSESSTRFQGHSKVRGTIGLAELALYETEDLVIQPLVREGKLLLEAAYHPTLREQAEPVLKRERENFRRLLTNPGRLDLFRMKGSTLSLSRGAVQVWGTFWGSFWRAYTE